MTKIGLVADIYYKYLKSALTDEYARNAASSRDLCILHRITSILPINITKKNCYHPG
jgi:hypothetical protein